MSKTHSRGPVQDIISSSSSNYMVEKRLGKGGFGVVNQCRKMPANETVALKLIRNTKYIEEAKEEEKILKKLKQHNCDKFNIIRWNDSFLYEDCYCLEFEKLDMNLLEVMRTGPNRYMVLKDIRPILQQLATTLEFLDGLGIAHADLKPENIMVEDHQQQPLRIKVIDFGLASEISKIRKGVAVQTLWYRAPEILLGAHFSGTTDVWSLGCTAAEMFLGQALFRGANEYDMMRHILNTIGRPPQHLLNSGMYTLLYFNPTRMGQGSTVWTSKTPLEDRYYSCTMSTINSLSDLLTKKYHDLTGKDARAEHSDRSCFVDLLKKMLTLDAAERITASQILQHPFITMSHLTSKFSNSQHVKSCLDLMGLSSDGDKVTQPAMKRCLRGQPSTSTASVAEHVLHEGHPVGLSNSGESSQVKRSKRDRGECTSRASEKPGKKCLAACNDTAAKSLLHTEMKEETNANSLRPRRKRKNDVALESTSCQCFIQKRKRKHKDHTNCKVT